jgi:hypothetical protein
MSNATIKHPATKNATAHKPQAAAQNASQTAHNKNRPTAPAEPQIEEVEGESGKRGAKPKPVHPAIEALKTDADGNYTETIKALPADYVFGKFATIPRGAWAEDFMYFEYRAQHLEKMAAEMRQRATEYKQFGGKAVSKVKGLAKLQEKMAALQKKLAESGIDVEAALKLLAQQSTATPSA